MKGRQKKKKAEMLNLCLSFFSWFIFARLGANSLLGRVASITNIDVMREESQIARRGKICWSNNKVRRIEKSEKVQEVGRSNKEK